MPKPPVHQPEETEENNGLTRREAIKFVGFTAAAMLAKQMPAMAGPFDRTDFEKLVPADKKLDPAWVKSLFARGVPQVLKGAELKFVGMPVGGIGAGQLYLGGDGKLWHWDIFNKHIGTGAEHYARPLNPASPLQQGFALHITSDGKTQTHSLDSAGFANVTFRGEYPVGTVQYRDAALPVAVTLEAFSPFIPLSTDDSSLPVTVMQFTLKNSGTAPVEATLAGWLGNAVMEKPWPGTRRRNRIVRGENLSFLECSLESLPGTNNAPARPDIVFEDWNKNDYTGWKVEGTSFGTRPLRRNEIIDYQGDVGGEGDRMVNSHSSAPGTEVGPRDDAQGKLTSAPFKIEREIVRFWIGGGNHVGKTCLNLVIDGKVAASHTGDANNKMAMKSFDVREHQGKSAVIEIVDAQSGPWGNIGVGKITFSDRPGAAQGRLEEQSDFGTMGLGLLGAPAELAQASRGFDGSDTTAPGNETLVGTLGRKLRLAPGQTETVRFVLAWHFPNLSMQGMGKVGRFYATKFPSAQAVAQYVATNSDRLAAQTKLFRDTFYDSTLPYWFLDRTLLNASILASSTCYRFANGRFYAWEGVGCCPGTCVHVWHYAHSAARLFPELERDLRERTDYGIGFDEKSGSVRYRGEHNNHWAADAQAGTILRTLREHQMSPDGEFLKRNWPKVKKAMEFLMSKDANGDGILEGAQHNTLDADWFGKVAWLSGLYVAAARATAQMAREMGEPETVAVCEAIAARGAVEIPKQLFNGEYFMNAVDPAKLDAINSGTGCEIDQVMGQSWAFQVGLPRVLPEKETRAALAALWKFNFSPDVGPYRAANKPGRWYAMAGEAGLLMCSFPRTDWDYKRAAGKGPDWAAGYFNECMNGFEYQVAGHMIWEGMVQEGLAITRAVHDRYDASKRNPWNEVECGDHYARSMASHGVFLAACGFEHHGPNAHLGFAPRITPENFKAPFTTCEGWGSYAQKSDGAALTATIEIKYGQLRLKTLALANTGKTAKLTLDGNPIAATVKTEAGRAVLTLPETVIKAGQNLEVRVG